MIAESHQIFDRLLKKQQRDRAAHLFHQHDFLYREVCESLIDRLLDIKKNFPVILQLGAHDGYLTGLLDRAYPEKIDQLITTDLSESFLKKTDQKNYESLVCLDEERLPFKDGSFDLIIAPLTFHFLNALPQTLTMVRKLLKPDGLFIAALIGENSLVHLRHVLLEAEIKHLGGAKPHLSPSLSLNDLGKLMQLAGFSLPVLDKEEIFVSYDDIYQLMKDLRGMAQNNSLHARDRSVASSHVFKEADRLYKDLFARDDGLIEAQFDIIYISGWSQP